MEREPEKQAMIRKWFSAAILIAMMLAPSFAAHAQSVKGKGFKGVVKRIESQYKVNRNGAAARTRKGYFDK